MAKTTLPTNYVDDVLNGAMDGKRRYREIPNADGTISLEDATTYDQVGSNFGASQLNLMSDNINQSFDANKMLKTMDEVNAVTQEGYGVDALVVKQVNESLNGLEMKFIGKAIGSNEISIEDIYNDANIFKAYVVNTENRLVSYFEIPKILIEENLADFLVPSCGNYRTSSDYTTIQLTLTKTSISVRTSVWGTNNTINTAILYLYYS